MNEVAITIIRMNSRGYPEELPVGMSRLLSIRFMIGRQTFDVSIKDDDLKISSNNGVLMVRPQAANSIEIKCELP